MYRCKAGCFEKMDVLNIPNHSRYKEVQLRYYAGLAKAQRFQIAMVRHSDETDFYPGILSNLSNAKLEFTAMVISFNKPKSAA